MYSCGCDGVGHSLQRRRSARAGDNENCYGFLAVCWEQTIEYADAGWLRARNVYTLCNVVWCTTVVLIVSSTPQLSFKCGGRFDARGWPYFCHPHYKTSTVVAAVGGQSTQYPTHTWCHKRLQLRRTTCSAWHHLKTSTPDLQVVQ